jgi:hypothetical protein
MTTIFIVCMKKFKTSFYLLSNKIIALTNYLFYKFCHPDLCIQERTECSMDLNILKAHFNNHNALTKTNCLNVCIYNKPRCV